MSDREEKSKLVLRNQEDFENCNLWSLANFHFLKAYFMLPKCVICGHTWSNSKFLFNHFGSRSPSEKWGICPSKNSSNWDFENFVNWNFFKALILWFQSMSDMFHLEQQTLVQLKLLFNQFSIYIQFISYTFEAYHTYVPFKAADLAWSNWSSWSNQLQADCNHMNMKDRSRLALNKVKFIYVYMISLHCEKSVWLISHEYEEQVNSTIQGHCRVKC